MKFKKTFVLSILLCLAMVSSLCGCGSTEGVTLENDQIEADIQEYLTSFVDEDAKLTSTANINIPIDDTEQEVTSTFAYEINGEDAGGTFVLTYAFEDGAWVLKDYDDSGVYKPFSFEVDSANDVTGLSDGIKTDFDVDLSGIQDWGTNETREYPDSINGVSTPEDIAEIYTFSIDGKKYSLPIDVQDLLDDGWKLMTVESTDMVPERSYVVEEFGKGDSRLSTCIANLTDTEQSYNNCIVFEITVQNYSSIAFETGKGLKIGDDSSRVTKLYGDEAYVLDDTGAQYNYFRQLGYQENLFAIMKEYTVDDTLSIQWDSSGTIDYIQMKYLNE